MSWVEKASLEKICWLLEISDLERHHEVLLTPKNLADVRRNLVPYSLPIILCPLPSEIVEGEHFVVVDLLRLILGDASSSGGAEAETEDQRSAAQSSSGPSASNSECSGSAQPASRWGEGGSPPDRLPLPSRGGKSAPQVIKVKRKRANRRRNAHGTQVKDFVPWVRPEPSQPLDSENERKRR